MEMIFLTLSLRHGYLKIFIQMDTIQNPLLSYVNQSFVVDFPILFLGVVVWGLCGYVMGISQLIILAKRSEHNNPKIENPTR